MLAVAATRQHAEEGHHESDENYQEELNAYIKTLASEYLPQMLPPDSFRRSPGTHVP